MAGGLFMKDPAAGFPVQWCCRGLLLAGLMALSTGSLADSDKPRCLYATLVGEDPRPVMCGADPLQLARDDQVRKLVAAIEVAPESIRFRGCGGDVYAVKLLPEGGYLVTYPPDVQTGYIAPIAHELSHIVQIRAAGGWDELSERYSSRRIELGADYLAGILFRRVLPQISRNEFQNHVQLNGLYRERSDRAHGTPMQRTAAFRIGVVGWKERPGITLPEASEDFQENVYARVVEQD
jgi:hypothetical protein